MQRDLAPRVILPGHRIVAYYGEPDVPSMGVLGTGSIQRISARLLQQAKAYAGGLDPVIPAFEVIAVAAQRDPGAYGTYSASISVQRSSAI